MSNFIVYKTTNLINSKIYIGVHKVVTPDDTYLGSGKLIKKAIKKYGKNNFKRETLYTYSTLDEALLKENEIVNEEFINSSNTYNMALGGGCGGKHNGFTFKGKTHTPEVRAKLALKAKNQVFSEDTREKISKHSSEHKGRKKSISKALTGLKKSENHKKKISESLKKYNENLDKGNHPTRGKRKPTVKCPHCGKVGSKSVMPRWHFDNCKFAV